MNCKHLISRILAFFTSFVALIFGTSESFASTVYAPGETIGAFNYLNNVTFSAVYEKIAAQECPTGMVYDADSSSFVDCPAGYYCPGSGDSEIGCSQYICPENSYCVAGSSEPVSCAVGYQSESGSAECELISGTVPAGMYYNGSGVLVECTEGYYCPGGDEYSGTVEAGRYQCQNGQDCSGVGLVAPSDCAAGYYCELGMPIACPTNFENSAVGSDTIDDCYLITTPGKYVANSSGQSTCSTGYYCPGGITVYYGETGGREICEDLDYAGLAWGGTLTTPGLATPNYCETTIAAGYYYDGSTETVEKCPVDTYSRSHSLFYSAAIEGTDECSPCDEGRTTNGETGATYCELISYDITLDANDGVIVGGSSASNMTCTVESEDITLPTPTKTGYTFGGWYLNSDFSGDAITEIAAGTCLSDYSLYAKWEANTYTVTLNNNGGTGGATSVVATYGELLPSVEMPTMDGFTFKGYYSAQDGGTQYYNMSGNPVEKWMVDGAMILYAQWMADGECAPGTYYNEATGEVEPCPEGSYCAGGTWSTESDGEKCPVVACPTDYPNSVAGAEREGQCYKTVSRCWCTDDTTTCEEKGANSCSYKDVRFAGVTYVERPDICEAAPGSSDSTYCEITKVSCVAGTYYTPAGDIESGSCVSCATLGDGSYTRSYPALVLYTADSDNGETACFKSVDLPCTAPVCPEKGTGECTYDADSSILGGGYLFYGVEEPLPGSAEAYMCPNASFTCNTGYDANDDANIDPTDDVTDTASSELCTPHVYTIELDGNGGTPAETNVYQKYKTGWYNDSDATTEITRLPVPSREYYTFAGYYTTSTALEGGRRVTDENGRFISTETTYDNAMLTSDITLYAWWNVNTYTVKYNANGGTGTMDSVVHTCTQAQDLTPNAFTSMTNNREFLGWSTTATATEPEYTNGQSVINLSDTNGATVTLYAIWKDCTKCAAGTGAECTLTAPLGVCTYTTTCADNYSKLQNEGAYNPTCTATRYAVNLESAAGTNIVDYESVGWCSVESEAFVLPTAEQMYLEDYRFVGWYANEAFTGASFTQIPAGSCTKEWTFYAKWEINVEICQPGMFYNGTSFVDCPNGFYCPGEGKVTIGEAGCNESCPRNYNDGGTGLVSKSQCQITVPQGSYLSIVNNNSKITVCPAGTYTAAAVNVSYGNTSECSVCESGNYCDAGTKYSCSTATDGVFENSAASSDSIEDCYTVTSAGKYIVDNTVKACAAPYYCPGSVKVYYDNEGGAVSCADLSDDIEWKSGITSSGASTPDKCYVPVDAGQYWNGSSAVTCAAGTYKTAHQVYYGQTSSCTTCPAGYKSEAGASECYLVTEAGKYVATAGAGQVTCKAGDYCPGNITVKMNAVGGNTSCTTLGAGYTSAAGTKVADRCYTSCVTSAVQNATKVTGYDYYGASVADTCVATLCSAGYTVANGACALCAANHVCDPLKDAGKQYTCSELTDGVYTMSDAGTGSVDNCYLETSAGKYVATAGAGQVQCAANGYCPGGEMIKRANTGGRITCPDGYASDAGAVNVEQCYTTCSMYPNATQMSGRDYYGNATDTCQATECMSGYVLANGMCGSCPADNVCDPNYDGGKPHTCAELTGNKYTKSPENTVSVNACYTMTQPGYYVQVAGQGEVKCKVGDYCLGGTKVLYTGTGGNMTCSTFGAGFTSDIGATVETDCYQRCSMADNALQMSGRDYYGTDAADTCAVATCKAGYTLVSGVCEICPADHVCSPVKDNGKPYTCSELTEGMYTRSEAGSGTVDSCYLITTKGNYVAAAGFGLVQCAEDGYCVGGTKVMRTEIGGRADCPVGFDMADAGAESAQQCYTDCTNAANAIEMSGRDYYGKGADTCKVELCQAGYTLSEGKCVLCPENSVCRPDVEAGTPKTCAALTNGAHVLAKSGSDEISDCYTTCESYDVEYGKAVQLSDTEFYPANCRYKGVSVTGNPCNIVKGVCVETSCNYDYEMISGKCSPCARDNAVSYKVDGGNCVVESCVSGFHPNGQKCEADTAECSVPNAVSAERVWDSVKQTFGECVALECEDGYHLGGNVCQADEQLCEVEHGVGMREWNHKTNKWGDCIATKCDPGYTNDRSQTNELWKQCGRCNNMYSAGGELAASSYVDGCEIASCMYEGELYTLENNECVLICDTYSDETGSRKWNASRKKCERTCSPGYMSW